jgi:hypothetical protein
MRKMKKDSTIINILSVAITCYDEDLYILDGKNNNMHTCLIVYSHKKRVGLCLIDLDKEKESINFLINGSGLNIIEPAPGWEWV